MSDKSLKNKAVKIQGKAYVLVSDRVIYFNEVYPRGAIKTEQLESTDRVEFKATVIPDVTMPERFFTGHSQAVWGQGMVNKTSATENAETSAVGRALAMMGIGVIDSIASVDEINKAKTTAPVNPLEKPGVCDRCGSVAVKAKSGNRVFFTCPEWQNHKLENETFKIVQPARVLPPAEDAFAKSLI